MSTLLMTDVEVASVLGISKRQVHRLREKEANFPKPVRLGGLVKWRVTDISAYVASL